MRCVELGRRLAEARGAEMMLLHASGHESRERQERVAEQERGLQQSSSSSSEVRVERGSAHEVIAATAESTGASLVVMGQPQAGRTAGDGEREQTGRARGAVLGAAGAARAPARLTTSGRSRRPSTRLPGKNTHSPSVFRGCLASSGADKVCAWPIRRDRGLGWCWGRAESSGAHGSPVRCRQSPARRVGILGAPSASSGPPRAR